LLADTLTWRPLSETKSETVARNFEEQVEEICLADTGGPGLGSVRQSLLCWLIRRKNSG